MISMVHRILKFSDNKNAARIRLAYVFSFLKSFCQNAPVMLAVLVIRGLSEGNITTANCCIIAGILLLFLALCAFFQNISDRLQSSAGYKVFAEKRIEFAKHLRRLPMGYFTEGNIGRISSVLSEDMVFVEENSMSIIAEVVSGYFAQFVITVFMFVLHPLLGAAAMIVCLLVMFLSIPMNREALGNSGERQQSVEELSGAVIEYAEGMAVSRSFGITGESAGRLRESFAKNRDANLRFELQHTPWERAFEIIYAIGTAGVLFVAVWLKQEKMVDNAVFIGVMLFLMNIFTPFKNMYQLGSRLTIMDIALDRIERVFSEKQLYLDGKILPAEKYDHEIIFDNVSFSYDNEEVLHDISFKADKGQMIALVGESGSGKTTVANLMARFWDVENGEIRLCGVNIKDMPMETLMSYISMVFQKVYLFEDTVFNNISMGKDNPTYEEVIDAAKKARCYDFIMQLPYGFDTIIGEGGTSLSGGEAQRISIARCILKDAPIIILDEATASIDADNESYIKEAMSELCVNKTVIVIAHRLNTIQDADNIIVLEHGRIAEHGTHEKLMKQGGIYCRMAMLQMEMNDIAEVTG